jgi:hypothetical protein
MNPIDKNPVKGVESQDNTHNQDPDLEKIRYYKGTWKNFFDYWNKRGVKTDPYKGTVLKYPNEKVDNGNAPHQDFGTYDKKKLNKLTESFEEFVNESNDDSIPLVLTKNQDFEEVKRLLSTDKKAKDLNFTHWESGRYLGANRGNLITMFFSNTKDEVKDFIERNNIEVANKFAFRID